MVPGSYLVCRLSSFNPQFSSNIWSPGFLSSVLFSWWWWLLLLLFSAVLTFSRSQIFNYGWFIFTKRMNFSNYRTMVVWTNSSSVFQIPSALSKAFGKLICLGVQNPVCLRTWNTLSRIRVCGANKIKGTGAPSVKTQVRESMTQASGTIWNYEFCFVLSGKVRLRGIYALV